MTTSTWNIDSAHSGVHFAVRHLVFAKVRGRFASFRGVVVADAEDLANARAEVEIDVASIDTGNADRDKHLRSADFLDVEQYPTIAFKSTRVELRGDGGYRVHGELEMHGVAREIVLETTFGGRATDPWGGERVAFEAVTSLERGDFGIQYNQVLEAGGVLIGDKVEISIEIEAVKAAP